MVILSPSQVVEELRQPVVRPAAVEALAHQERQLVRVLAHGGNPGTKTGERDV